MFAARAILATCALLALLSAANACCLPHRFAMHFLAEVQGEKDGQEIHYNISGSVGADFDLQKFTLQYKTLHKSARKIWIFDMANGEYVYTFQAHRKPNVCKTGKASGEIAKDYKCFIGQHMTETGPNSNTYMVRLGNYAKILGHARQSDKDPDQCIPSGLNMFSGSSNLGNSMTVKLLVTKVETGSKAGINFSPKCAERREVSQGFTMPTLEKLSKMSGKGVAALFSQVPSDEEIASPAPTPSPTSAVETGSGSGGGGNGGDSDDDDDNTDGTVSSGAGGDKEDEKEECELPESLRGDVDCDGDYDDYDKDYWEYFWNDEDSALEAMEEEYEDRR